MKQLIDSMNPADCNCQQCKELRVVDRIREYFDNPANCVSLTPSELYTFFPIRAIREGSVAAVLINQYLVVCRDGFIRKR
jgi:hypothetical protein